MTYSLYGTGIVIKKIGYNDNKTNKKLYICNRISENLKYILL